VKHANQIDDDENARAALKYESDHEENNERGEVVEEEEEIEANKGVKHHVHEEVAKRHLSKPPCICRGAPELGSPRAIVHHACNTG
jgi:hypothetical protein